MRRERTRWWKAEGGMEEGGGGQGKGKGRRWKRASGSAGRAADKYEYCPVPPLGSFWS